MSGVSREIAELLHGEVSELMEEVSGLLFNEPLEEEALEEQLKQLRGVLNMLQLTSATTLLDELIKTVTSLVAKQQSIGSYQVELAPILEVITQLIKALPDIKQEVPFLFMPELAQLRKLQGLPPLYEFQLLEGFQWPDSGRFAGKTELNEESLGALKKLKQLYQVGLLDILRGTNQQQGAETLAKVTEKLQLLFQSEAEKYYWGLVQSVVTAYARQGLSINTVRMRLLAAVERQLKTLLDNNTDQNAYPLGLWRAFAILLSMVDDKDTRSSEICEWVGAPKFPFSEADLVEVRSLVFGKEDDTLDTFLGELDSRVAVLHDLLERVDSQGNFSPDEANEFKNVLGELGSFSGEKGLTRAAERFAAHRDGVGEVADSPWQPDSDLLKETAHTILYLECLAHHLRHRSHAGTALLQKLNQQEVDEVVEKNLVSTSEYAVWDECLKRLTGVKTLLDDIASEMAGEEVSGELTSAFDEIQGAAAMVGHLQVTEIAKRCREFAGHNLFGGEQEASVKLGSFADTIVALEYYFSNAMQGQQTDFVLSIAEDNLAGLGA